MKNKLFDVFHYINHIKYLQHGNFFCRHFLFPWRLFKWWVITRIRIWRMIYSKDCLTLKELIYEFGLMMYELYNMCDNILAAAIIENRYGRTQVEITTNKKPDLYTNRNTISQVNMFISIKMPRDDLIQASLICSDNLGDVDVNLYIKEADIVHISEPVNQRYIIVPNKIERLLRHFASNVILEVMKKSIIKL